MNGCNWNRNLESLLFLYDLIKNCSESMLKLDFHKSIEMENKGEFDVS